MAKAIFSSSWYRVAALKPRLRSHAEIHRHQYRGQTWYVLQELTMERFLQHPFTNEPGARLYKTGDRARFLAGRDIEYLGRVDDQIKVRGFRVEPAEIESALSRHPLVREAVVIVREDKPCDKRLIAYAVTRQPAPTPGELRRFLQDRLPDYMLPSTVVALDKLPLTSNSGPLVAGPVMRCHAKHQVGRSARRRFQDESHS